MNSILPVSAFAFCTTIFLSAEAKAQDFGLPLDCTAAGVTCRIQQYVDMDTSPAVQDPFCSTATYDGHQGTDFRVLSMADVAKGIPVIAMKHGRILRVRDGEPDKIVATEADRAAVANKECGNGLVIDFGELEVQYCHLRQGSIVVEADDIVAAGQKLGEIGASGLAQFPHVHVTVRQNGVILDPMTGKTANADPACSVASEPANSLWSTGALETLKQMAEPLLDAGIAGAPPAHGKLSTEGAPPAATTADAATVGWVWFANLQKGDQIKLTLRAPDGSVFSENLSEPLDRNKADYSAFVGRKRAPTTGKWVLEIGLMRGGTKVFEERKTIFVK